MNLELLMEILAEIPEKNTTKSPAFDINSLLSNSSQSLLSYKVNDKTSERFKEIIIKRVNEIYDGKDPDCYEKIAMDRRYFHNYVNGKAAPTREQVIMLAVALKLPLNEAEEFLAEAGYAFRPSDKSEMLIKDHISRGLYDPYNINNELFEKYSSTYFFKGKKSRKKDEDNEI